MGSEQNVPFGLDAKCMELASFVCRIGPANTRCLIDTGHFNYTTYKPHCNHLLDLGIFRIDEKRRFRLTPKAGPLVVEGWSEKTLLGRCKATHADNLEDLGLLDEVFATLNHLYPVKLPITESIAPLPLNSKPVQDVLEIIRKLDPDDPEERIRGLTLLNLIGLGQHPQTVREMIRQADVAVDRIILAGQSQSLLSRAHDWFWVHV